MNRFEVSFRPLAEADLADLYSYIARQGGLGAAGAYIDRIEAACQSLQTFPERGMRRDDISPGLRTIGFERRATIAFRIKGREVIILRVFCGGQEYERVLRGTRDRE